MYLITSLSSASFPFHLVLIPLGTPLGRFFHENKKDIFLKHLKENLNIDLNLDPNPLMDKILLALKDAINKTFPLKKVSRKQALKLLNPWMTNEICNEQKTRDALKKMDRIWSLSKFT